MSAHTIQAIKESIFEKHAFSLKSEEYFLNDFLQEMKFKVAVLHKFQFNMYPKRMTAFERNYIKYVPIAEKQCTLCIEAFQ